MPFSVFPRPDGSVRMLFCVEIVLKLPARPGIMALERRRYVLRFFAYLSRLKLIRRWSLMRNTQPENDAEHSLQVAMIAHAIAVIGRDRYGRDTDPEHVLALAVYHDATEVMTGDLPTPVKYHNNELRSAYHRLEDVSADRLLALLPPDLRPPSPPA